MYKIEFIYKQSVLDDILPNWHKMGKTRKNDKTGGFVFEADGPVEISADVIQITHNGSQFIYNMADFYRVKITKTST